MIFLLNFTQFDAIIANFETHFAYFETDFANFETKIPDRFGRIWDGGQNNAVEKNSNKICFFTHLFVTLQP